VRQTLREAQRKVGLAAGTELELDAVEGRLEVSVPSRVRVEVGEHGVQFAAHDSVSLTSGQVRELMERGRH
jgi:hypothetical protein